MKIKNLKSNMSKLLLIAGLATAMYGCDSSATVKATPSPKTEGNTEVTPTPEVTPEINVTEGYYIIPEDGKEFNFDNFIFDQMSYNYLINSDMCENYKDLSIDFLHYQETGEIRINNKTYFGPENTNILESTDIKNDTVIVQYAIDACPVEMNEIKGLSK